jgi:hypothetical protein
MFEGIVGFCAAVLTFVILLIYWNVNDVVNKPWDTTQLQTLFRIFIIGGMKHSLFDKIMIDCFMCLVIVHIIFI